VSAAPLAHTCQGAGNISTGVRAILYLLRSLASTYIHIHILSLFVICYGCPRYWGRQQARTSNTSSPSVSVMWTGIAHTTYTQIGLDAIRPRFFLGLPRPQALGISMFIMVLVQLLREAWPNHLRLLVRRAMATSWIPKQVKNNDSISEFHRKFKAVLLYHHLKLGHAFQSENLMSYL